MQQKKNTKIRYFNILVTGDNNYNNLNKFNVIMTQIRQSIQQVKCIGTFGGKYGAQVLAQLFAQQEDIKFKEFNTSMFKNVNRPQGQLYHILLSVATKWSDLVIIFSDVYNNKIKQIIDICKRNDKDYIIIKE